MSTRTRPTTPRIRPTIRRSCPGRGTSLPVKGESRGGKPPLARGLGDVPPGIKNLRGRVGGPNQRRNAEPSLPLPPRRTCCRRSGFGFDFVFFANESPYLRRLLPGTNMASFEIRSNPPLLASPAPWHAPEPATPPTSTSQGVGAEPAPAKAGGSPCLVSLCRFLPIFRRGRRPPFGPRPRRYDSFLFVDFSDAPQRGHPTTVRPVPGRYDLSPFVDLSSAAQTQAAPRPPRHWPDGKSATDNSKQLKPLRPMEVCEAHEPGSGS